MSVSAGLTEPLPRDALVSYGAVGALLAALLLAITLMAPHFAYGAPLTAAGAFGFAGTMMVAGLSAPALVLLASRATLKRSHFILMLIAGAAFRLIFLGSTPIYEDDWHRYLWDGAVLAEGVSPYHYAPAEALLTDFTGAERPLSDDPRLRALQQLGAGDACYPERVNYPYLTTIYPPTAQFAAFLASKIAPFDLNAWRAVLFAFDGAGLALLLVLLRRAGRNPCWALVYWWNPLLIVTVYNAAHMDILLVPFLLGALLLMQQERPRAAALALAGAVGVKLWPLILAPALFVRFIGRPWALLSAGALLALGSALLIAPMALALLAGNSGLEAYSTSWQRFSFLFAALKGALSLFTSNADGAARIIVTLAVSGAALYAAQRAWRTPERLAGSLLLVVASLFFLSPTGYPWYAIWFLALLPLAPSYGLAAATATLPIYYLRYYLAEAGREAAFDAVLTPLAFAVPLAILAFEQWRRRHD